MERNSGNAAVATRRTGPAEVWQAQEETGVQPESRIAAAA